MYDEITRYQDIAIGRHFRKATYHLHRAKVEKRRDVGSDAVGLLPHSVHQEMPHDDEKHRHHPQYLKTRIPFFCHCLFLSFSFIRIHILPMPHSVSAILDGKSRAMVQTAQTQCALRLDPHRLAAAHLYRRRRASVGTKSATGTTVCHQMEMPRLPLATVGGMINTSNHMRYSHSLCVSAPAGHNSAYRCVYLATAALPLVGQIEQRSPRVHHTHRQTGIDSHTFIQQRFASHPTSLSGRRTVGGDGIDKATPRIRKCQRF